MCGLVGYANPTKDVSCLKNILKNMNNKISRRGPDEDGIYLEKNICMAHKRLIVIDPEGGKQPMILNFDGNTYVIVYNGQLYNTEDLKTELKEYGFNFETRSDTEVLLKSFVHWKYDVVNHLNGIFAFAIWNCNEKELFFARDHFGVKPFYYSIINDTFVFSSEVKALFEFPGIKPKIDEEGICELFGLGPAHTPGNGIFKNIYELKPAHLGIFNSSGLTLKKYWSLKSLPHTDSFGTTCDTVRYLLEDSIKRQLVSDVPICTFLSGVSGFTYSMQGESSQKNEKDLKNGASTKDKNQKVIKLDSMQSATKKDIDAGTTYLSVMTKNLEILKDALE